MPTGFGGGNMKERHHLENLRVNWEDNIRTDMNDIAWKAADWIHLRQNMDT